MCMVETTVTCTVISEKCTILPIRPLLFSIQKPQRCLEFLVIWWANNRDQNLGWLAMMMRVDFSISNLFVKEQIWITLSMTFFVLSGSKTYIFWSLVFSFQSDLLNLIFSRLSWYIQPSNSYEYTWERCNLVNRVRICYSREKIEFKGKVH